MKSFVLAEQQLQEYGVLQAAEHPMAMKRNQSLALKPELEELPEVVVAGLVEA